MKEKWLRLGGLKGWVRKLSSLWARNVLGRFTQAGKRTNCGVECIRDVSPIESEPQSWTPGDRDSVVYEESSGPP